MQAIYIILNFLVASLKNINTNEININNMFYLAQYIYQYETNKN